MDIKRKVAAIAGSAMLLSSIFTVIAAPGASAAVGVASAGTVAAGGTSAGNAVISVTENTAACFAPGASSPALVFTIRDSAGAATVHWSGVPALFAQGSTTLPPPGSLGATVTLTTDGVTTNDQIRVNFAGSDLSTIEKFDIDPKIAADAGAATGAVQMQVTGSQTGCVVTGTTTATGVVQVGVLAGAGGMAVTVNSVCGFSQSTGGGADPNASKLAFNDGVLAESINTTGVGGVPAQSFATPNGAIGATQGIAFFGVTVNGHAAFTSVSQTVSNCSAFVGAPATVINGTTQTSSVTQVGNNPTTVNPGEQNQAAGFTTETENAKGVIQPGTETYTLSQPATGSVKFSTPPTVTTTTNTVPVPPPVLALAAVAPSGSCPAGTFFYSLEAVYGATHTDLSQVFSATTTTAGSAYKLDWTATAGAPTGYNIYRSTSGGPGTWQLIGPAVPTVGAVTTFTDPCVGPTYGAPGVPPINNSTLPTPAVPTVTPSTTGGAGFAVGNCTYQITASTGANETVAVVAGTTVAYTTPTSSAVITWAATPGATSYIVYRTTSAGCPTPAGAAGAVGAVTVGNHIILGNVLTVTDLGTTTSAGAWASGGLYTFAPFPGFTPPLNPVATALNSSGLAAGTYCYTGTSQLNTGESLNGNTPCIAIVAGGSVNVTWPAVPAATGYRIYGRPALAAGPYGRLVTTTALAFVDDGTITPGVALPTADTTVGVAIVAGGVCVLSPDRQSCTVTVTTAGKNQPSTKTLGGIFLDVSSDATIGAAVKVTITNSPAVTVIVSSNTIAFIARVVVGLADQPTVFINYNDQHIGTIKLVESAPGFFNAGVGGNNAVGLCLITGETFTRAPFIIVTTGDLKLNDGAGNPVSKVAGTLYTDPQGNACVRWTIYSASTVASTITIVGNDATGASLDPTGIDNGANLSVGPGLRPGTTQAVVLIGSQVNVAVGALFPPNISPAFSKLVSAATRAYKSGVTVGVVGTPPFMAPGSDPLAANITISESLNGQLKAGDIIVVQILPRSTRLRSDVLMSTGSTNQLPIVTTNASSGLLVSPVFFPGAPLVNCQPAVPAVSVCAFAFTITQQAFGPATGQITISNMDYIVAPDAALGPVQVNVSSVPAGNVGVGGGVVFNQVITNAIIGAAPLPPALTKTSAASAVTKTQSLTAFSVGTKTVKLGSNSANPNNIVTIRLKMSPTLVGQSVTIQVAAKSSSGAWSAFHNVTGRVIGSDGYAYFYASAHSAQWLSFRGSFAGNASWAPSVSQTVQVHWIN